MSFESQVSELAFATDGVTTSFGLANENGALYFMAPTDIRAALVASDGTITALASPADFTVTGDGRTGSGILATAIALPDNGVLKAWCATPIVQPERYLENDSFPAATHETAQDRGRMIDRDLARTEALSLRVADFESPIDMRIPLDRADKLLAFDSVTKKPVATSFTQQDYVALSGSVDTLLQSLGLGGLLAGTLGALESTAALLGLFPTPVLLADGTTFVTGGRDAPGPGGGTYSYDAADTVTADDGGTVRVDAHGRRFKLQGKRGSPELFGAQGTGASDDTGPLTLMLAALNAGRLTVIDFTPGATYPSDPLPNVTAPGWVLHANGGRILANADSWDLAGFGSGLFGFGTTADNVVINDLVLDGQQNAFTVNPGRGRLLGIGACSNVVLRNVVLQNSPYDGAAFDQVTGLSIQGGGAFNCTNQGYSFNTCKQFSIDAANRRMHCGFGFHNDFSTNAFAAFGVTVGGLCEEFYIDGTSEFIGRDGVGIGQGSHAGIVRGRAYLCGDAGFSMFNDAGSVPGAGTSPYDLDFDVQSFGNYGSGVASYCAVDRVRIRGSMGNNGNYAGDIAALQASASGVALAGGSTNFDIDVTVYDDRQTCPVTAVAVAAGKATLTVTGWKAGTAAIFPKVLCADGNAAFLGFGKIFSEADGQVVIETTAHDGVTLGDLAIGCLISQCVQTSGVSIGNGAVGAVHATGFGHRKAQYEWTGRLVQAGGYDNGTQVRLPKGMLDKTEILTNPDFAADLTGWTAQAGHEASATRITAAIKSAAAMKLDGTGGAFYVDGTLIASAAAKAADSFVVWRARAFSNLPQQNLIQLFFTEGSDFSLPAHHPGGGWQWLECSGYLPPSITALPACRVNVGAGNIVIISEQTIRCIDLPQSNCSTVRPAYLTTAPSWPVP